MRCIKRCHGGIPRLMLGRTYALFKDRSDLVTPAHVFASFESRFDQSPRRFSDLAKTGAL
jgi:hypothetical protein